MNEDTVEEQECSMNPDWKRKKEQGNKPQGCYLTQIAVAFVVGAVVSAGLIRIQFGAGNTSNYEIFNTEAAEKLISQIEIDENIEKMKKFDDENEAIDLFKTFQRFLQAKILRTLLGKECNEEDNIHKLASDIESSTELKPEYIQRFKKLTMKNQKAVILKVGEVKAEKLAQIITDDNLKEILNDAEIIRKLSSNCDENCKKEKKKSLDHADELISKVAEQTEEQEEKYENLKKVSEFINAISTMFGEYYKLSDEQREKQSARFQQEADELKGQLTMDQKEAMINIFAEHEHQIKTADIAEISAIINSKNVIVKQKLLATEHISKKMKDLKRKVTSELITIKNGIKSMSKTEVVSKTSEALVKVLGSVKKFESGKPIDVMSGVADIANAVANFLPPPASIVTGAMSTIFGIYATGSPSTEDVVKEEFKKMKNFTEEQFQKQNRFITEKFEKQFENVKEFLNDGEFDDALIAAQAQQKAMDEKLTYLNADHDYHNDEVTKIITQDIQVLKDTTLIEKIRGKLEKLCFDTDFMKVNHTFLQNQLCTDLLYTYLQIEQHREIILTSLINKIYQSKNLRGVAVNYLAVDKKRKEETRLWLKKKIIDSIELACPLFVTSKQYWTNPIFVQKIKDFIRKTDGTFLSKLDGLDIGQCESVEQENLIKYCGCNKDGSQSLICDIYSKCNCKKNFTGQKCDLCNKDYRGDKCEEFDCPQNWSKFGRSCFLYSNSGVNWNKAVANCQGSKGYLTSVHSAEENQFILGLTKGNSIWLGASDSAEEGHWVWLDGTNVSSGFNGWMEGGPYGDRGLNCLVYYKPMRGPEVWYDAFCNSRHYSVCRKDF